MDKKIFQNAGFASGIIEELKRVSWPTKKQTTKLTLVVIVASLIIGFYIGIIDILLTKGLDILTKLR